MRFANRKRRKEKRLYCNWPIWFAKGFDQPLYHGRITSIATGAVAFVCETDGRLSKIGDRLSTSFGVPQIGTSDSSDMLFLARKGSVCRVDELGKSLRRIAIQFDEVLPFKPCKLAMISMMFDFRRRLEAVGPSAVAV